MVVLVALVVEVTLTVLLEALVIRQVQLHLKEILEEQEVQETQITLVVGVVVLMQVAVTRLEVVMVETGEMENQTL
jgi:hypothetical protein